MTSSVNVRPTLRNVDSNAVSRETNDRASIGTNKGKDIDTARTDQVIYLGTSSKGEDSDTRIGLSTNNSSSIDQQSQHLMSLSFLELSGMCKSRNLPFDAPKSHLLASLVNYNESGSPQVCRDEVMEIRWWSNNSGAG